MGQEEEKQELEIIKAILEFVDEKGVVPGSNQLFSKYKKINIKSDKNIKDIINKFIKKDNNKYFHPKYEKLMEIRHKYLEKKFKPNDWQFSEFYHWFIGAKECAYCGTSQEILNALFKENGQDEYSEKDKKPLYSKKISFTSSLQIDRKIPDETNNNGYYKDNCALICTFCNNAKSDMIKSGDEFKENFGEVIGIFLLKKYNEMMKSR